MTAQLSTENRPAPRVPPRARRKRGEGQWALGYREPLNPNEQSKKDDHPLHVRARIENIYAARGFASIDPGDLRGGSGGSASTRSASPASTAARRPRLEPHELDDEYFMLRIRIDGGALTTEQLRVIGQISVDFARDTADVTDRQNVQLHWIRIEDVPEIWRRLEAVGLSTTEACGDCPRVILGSPVAGIAADEIIDPSPAIRDIVDRYIGDPAYANLPRKFKTALTGHPSQDVVPEVNDVAFVGVVHPEHGPGFDVWVGGGLSTNPMLASRLGAWIPRDEVAEVWAGVVGGLPGLRLPPAALPRPDQVPGRRLGCGEVPRGARDRVPEAEPDRRSGPGDPHQTWRPRRRQPAEGRPALRRLLRDRRPDQRQQSARGWPRSPSSTARGASAPPRCRRSWSSTCPRTGWSR